MSRPKSTRLNVLGFAISVFIAEFFGLQTTNAQDRDAELSITIVCVDIESLTYQNLQEDLDSLAKARNCQRGGLQRHELTGVFGSTEIRNAISSLVDARRADVCWFDHIKIRYDQMVDVPIGDWKATRSGTGFVAERGSLELHRGKSESNLEAIGIRAGMGRRRWWPGKGGVPGLHGGPSHDLVKVRPGQTIVIADRPVNWPDSIFLGADDEYKERLRRQDAAVRKRRLMLIEVPPRIRAAQRSGQTISSSGYATRPRNAAGS